MRSILAGNWKMNMDASEAQALVGQLKAEMLQFPIGVEVIIAPAFPFLLETVKACERTPLQVSAQNCHEAPAGAFTGEVSVAMLKSSNVTYCIVGHSERRQYFNEHDAAIGLKMKALLAQGITPIYCCGEKKEEREAAKHFEVVSGQINTAFKALDENEKAQVVVAYEPVWAIGTGLTATADQAQEMHAHIRGGLGDAGGEIPILYGGSCKPANAEELFSCPDVNGGLIGGAALNAADFLSLINTLSSKKANA